MKMKKNEAIEQGKAAGVAAFEKLRDAAVTACVEDAKREDKSSDARSVLRSMAGLQASIYMALAGMHRNDAYFDAFVQAFSAEARGAYWGLPEVKAKMRDRVLLRRLEEWEKDGKESVRRFADRVLQNAQDAFEWADSPMQYAGKAAVAAYVRAMLASDGDRTPATTEQVLDYAREQAVRAARYPERSSSQVSNIAKQYMAAAWAELSEVAKW